MGVKSTYFYLYFVIINYRLYYYYGLYTIVVVKTPFPAHNKQLAMHVRRNRMEKKKKKRGKDFLY